jgi:hypothetical protein
MWLWKALLVFVAIAFAGQLLGVIFNKRSEVLHPSMVPDQFLLSLQTPV